MAVRILSIEPKPTSPTTNSVSAHFSIQDFKWINEQTLEEGVSNLDSMFDWIVNKKGRAYIKKNQDMILVFGAVASSGQKYLRCIKDGNWSDDLLELPSIIQ